MRRRALHRWLMAGLLAALPSHLAAQSDPLRDALEQLFARALPAEPKTPQEALWHAAAKGDLARIHALLADGVPVDAVDERGNSALMIAAWRGHAQAVTLLLDQGASIDLQDNYGKTALFIATWFKRVPVVKELLARDANTELRATTPAPGGTPLVRAVDEAHEEIVQLLLSAGADLLATDNEGVTPLTNARDSRRAVYKRITALLEAEAARRITAVQAEAGTLLDEAASLSSSAAVGSITTGEALSTSKAQLARWGEINERVAEIERLLAKLGSRLVAAESARLQASAKALEDARGRVAQAEEVVAALERKAKLEANWAAASKTQSELGRPARSAVELAQRRELLASYERLLTERRQLVSQLDEAAAAAEQPRLAAMSKKLAQLTVAVAKEGLIAEAAQLDVAYRQLAAQRKAQEAKYSLAFRTPAQATEARRLLDLLRQMEANRRAASGARPDVASELSQIRSDIERLQAREPGLR